MFEPSLSSGGAARGRPVRGHASVLNARVLARVCGASACLWVVAGVSATGLNAWTVLPVGQSAPEPDPLPSEYEIEIDESDMSGAAGASEYMPGEGERLPGSADGRPRLVTGFAIDGLGAWGLEASALKGRRFALVPTADGWVGPSGSDDPDARMVTLSELSDDPFGAVLYDSAVESIRSMLSGVLAEDYPYHNAMTAVNSFTVDQETGVATVSVAAPGPIAGDDGPYLVRGFRVDGLGAWGVQADPMKAKVPVIETGLGLLAADEAGDDVRVRTLGSLDADSSGGQMVYQSVLEAAGTAVGAWLETNGVDYGEDPGSFTIDQETGVATLSLSPPGPSSADVGSGPILVREVVVTGVADDGLTEQDVLDQSVRLAADPEGLYAPRAGLPTEIVRIGALPELYGYGAYLYPSARGAIASALNATYEDRGLAAFLANVQLSADGVLTINLTQGRVSSVRTVVTPEGDDASPRQNDPAYAKIVNRSPVQSEQLVNIGELDSYVHRLNRHPGRQVDVALAPGDASDRVTLDYLISESDPLLLYAQATNTGTEETSEWRERFGLVHYNLTDFDDILSVDYITGDFDSVHAVTASYERPLRHFLDPLKFRVFGKYVEYDASQVGFGDRGFQGETWGVGGEFIWNFHQSKSAFFDAIAGVRYEDVQVDNEVADITGESGFLLPYVGLRFQDESRSSTTNASITLEWGSAEEDAAELNELGRFDVAEDWTVFRYDLAHSFFLDPILTDWDTSETPTLAHEIYISASGQISFDDRLAPNFVETVGGFYTVRGYPEAFGFGDKVYRGTVEYRFHLPRALGVSQGDPGGFLWDDDFRWRSQEALGPIDWDLIFRGFLDVGYAQHVDPLIFEDDATLVGAGLGVELTVWKNLSLRADWGVALRDEKVDTEKVTAGSSRFHFAFTVVF